MGMSDETDETDGYFDVIRRYIACQWLNFHYGHVEADHEEGTLYFKCVRCGERVDEHIAEYCDRL